MKPYKDTDLGERCAPILIGQHMNADTGETFRLLVIGVQENGTPLLHLETKVENSVNEEHWQRIDIDAAVAGRIADVCLIAMACSDKHRIADAMGIRLTSGDGQSDKAIAELEARIHEHLAREEKMAEDRDAALIEVQRLTAELETMRNDLKSADAEVELQRARVLELERELEDAMVPDESAPRDAHSDDITEDPDAPDHDEP